MPLKAPEAYELDRSDTPPIPSERHRFDDDEDSEVSEIDEFDPLKSSSRPYKDDASQPLRSVFDSERNPKQPLAWLENRRRKGGWQYWYVPSRFCWTLVMIFLSTLVLLLSAGGVWIYKNSVPGDGQSDPWYPSPAGGTQAAWASSYEKAARLVAEMTLVEKVNVTTGTGWMSNMCVGNTGPVDRLGFPSLCLQDGPLGLRFIDDATAFPAGITVGATWNKNLMYEKGKAHGFEARMKGVNVLLGPSMGPLGRLPAGGRNWEGFGSDPVLQGIAAAQMIKGIQSSGVIATAKHWIGNEQEHFRQSWEWATPNALSSNIDDRTLHEIYAWPFAESVRAGVASVMCSYNQINNSYACQNSKLLNGILKDELGFQGFVQSDWLAQRSGVASALAGLDMSMPGDGLRWQDGKSLWGQELTKSVLNGSVPIERLDDMVLRIVAAWYLLGQDDRARWPNNTLSGSPNFSSWTDEDVGKLHPGSSNSNDEAVVNQHVPVRVTADGGNHDELARKIATEGVVLVKNDNELLPLSPDGSKIRRLSKSDKIKIGIFGEDAYANVKGDNACPDRNCNDGTLAMGWGSGAVELPYLVTPIQALHDNFDSESVQITEWNKNDVLHIDQVAKEQDLCIVFINSDAGEGFTSWGDVKGDRNDLFSQKGGDKLVEETSKYCGGTTSNAPASDTIVVVHTVGPMIVEKWIDLPGVKSVLIAHLPGQESGNALADIIFGRANPSGHLPYTIAKQENDYGPDSKILRFPNAVVPQQDFSEGLYIDYRYFDKHGITPRYEFGYGLSYTTFELSLLVIQPKGLTGLEPKPRPEGLKPPQLDSTIPDAKTTLWPANFRKLKNYIYPYLDKASDGSRKHPIQFPDGYSLIRPPSQAGGSEGGNPDLYTTAAVIRAKLTNTGSVAGSAVVQVYISYPENVKDSDGVAVDMPVRVLRNFEKVFLNAKNASSSSTTASSLSSSSETIVGFELTRKDLSYWDVKKQNWIMPEGEFEVLVGFSSRDLRVKGRVSPRDRG